MRWWVILACALGGCGRLAFEAHDATRDDASPGDALGDTGGDGLPATRTCLRSDNLGVDFASKGTVITDVLVAHEPDGYAIGAVMDEFSALWGVMVDTQFIPNVSTPVKTSPIGTGGYSDGNMFWTGSLLVGAMDNGDNTLYLKVFVPDMSGFLSSDLRTGEHGSPSVGRAGSAVLSTWSSGTDVTVNLLATDGTPSTSESSVATGATIVSTSVASGPAQIGVALEYATGACDLLTVDASFNTTRTILATSCRAPRIVRFGPQWATAFERGSDAVVAIGNVETTLAGGRAPVPFVSGGEVLVAYRSGTSLAIARASTGDVIPVVGMPATVHGFEVADEVVFVASNADLFPVNCP